MWNIDSPTIRDGLAISGAFAYDIDEGGTLLAVELASGDYEWRKTYGLDAMYSPGAWSGRRLEGRAASGCDSLADLNSGDGSHARCHTSSPFEVSLWR